MNKVSIKIALAFGFAFLIFAFSTFVSYKLGEKNAKKENNINNINREIQQINGREVKIVFSDSCSNIESKKTVENFIEKTEYCAIFQSEINAFEFLKQFDKERNDFSFDYKEFSFGAFITAINNFSPDQSKQFWSLWYNGKQSETGISNIKIKNGDILEFKLADITF